jgi:sulfur-carrier protein adenylyltransferase/sulfurtransferase
MGLKDYFIPAKNMSVDEARRFFAENKEQDFTLLDVRQPGEYEQSRLPGAVLVPIPELPSRLGELDREKPVVVY